MFGQTSIPNSTNNQQNNTNNPTNSPFPSTNNPPNSLFGSSNAPSSLFGGNANSNPPSLFGKPATATPNSSTNGMFTSNLFARPSPVAKDTKEQQAKSKQNPAFSFFPVNQSNEQKQIKKSQVPQQSGLFGSSSMLSVNKVEGTDTSKSNTISTSLFAKKPEISTVVNTAPSKNEEKPGQQTGLFSNHHQSLFASQSSAQIQNQTDKPPSVKNQNWNNFGSNNSNPLFSSNLVADKKNEPKADEQKSKQNQQVQTKKPLFSGQKGFTSEQEKAQVQSLFSNPDRHLNPPPQNKSLFGFSSTNKEAGNKGTQPVLFNNTPPGENNKALSFAKPKQQQSKKPEGPRPPEQTKTKPAEQIKNPVGSLFGQPFKKTEQKTIETNPAPATSPLISIFSKKTEEKQKKEDDQKHNSLFAQPLPKKKQEQENLPTFGAFKNEQNKQTQSNEISFKSNKLSENVSTNLPQTSKVTNLSSDANQTLPTQTQKAQTEKNNPQTSNIVEQNIKRDKNQQRIGQILTSQTGYEQPQSLISRDKPKEFNVDTFMYFNKLKKEQKLGLQEYFLADKRPDIIHAIKVYLSLGQPNQKPKEAAPNTSQKDRFYIDLTNKMIQLDQLDSKHYQTYQKFIRNVMKEQKIEERLFMGDKWSQKYSKPNNADSSMYSQSYAGYKVLNQLNPELRFIFEKVLENWYIDKVNYLNFLMTNPDFIRPKEDLYSYLLTYLLKLEMIKQFYQEGSPLKHTVRDYQRVVTKKLIELLHHYNRKLGKNYKNLLTDQSEKYISSIVPLIERLKSQQIITLCLRIILNNINLNQSQKIDKNLIKSIRQTKSSALLPLRAILTKLKQKKLEFAPNPKDLYRYINGDQWVDWLDCYLSAGDKSNLQLNLEEAKYLIQALSTLTGSVLIDRLITNKKGIYKFFDVLKEQNLVEHYYKILECCLYNEQSIKEIDEFYFKKTYFSTDYQQIKEFIINYTENQSKPIQQKLSQASVISTLYPQISLLARIIEIEPAKLFDLQKYIFDPEFGRNKKIKITSDSQPNLRQGHKLVHLFIDLITITSNKGLDTKLLAKVFKVLTALLRNKKTEQIVVAAMYINKPSFQFIERAQLPKQTNEALTLFLDHIINSSYLYDLIISANVSGEQSTTTSPFYALRYNDNDYCRLLSSGQQMPSNFSIFWVNKLFITSSKQKFNPVLLQKVLAKLNIPPSPIQEEKENIEYGVKRYRRCERNIPEVFQMIINLVNSFPIWQQICKVLNYKIFSEEGSYRLQNMYDTGDPNIMEYYYVFATLKLLRTVFTLNQLLVKNQISNPTHFITRILSQLRILNKLEVSTTMGLNERGNILLGLLANIQTEQPLYNDTLQKITWQVEYQQEDNARFQLILDYVSKNKLSIDFQQVINIYKNPQNMYYECIDNISTISLQCIIYFLRLGTDNYLQACIMSSLQVAQQQKLKMRNNFLDKLSKTLTFYLSEDEFRSIRYKFLQFIYDLKYNIGKNNINQGLADQFFTEFLKIHQSQQQFNQTRLNHILIRYLEKDLKLNTEKFENSIQQITLDVINSFELKDSYTNRHLPIKDTNQIGNMLLRYHQKEYSFFSFNQLQRILDEKSIIKVGQKLLTLHYALEILMKQVIKRKYSHYLSLALNAINRVIAQYNLLLIINDIPFEYFNLPKSQESQLQTRSKRPRQFLRDSFELFLAQGKNLQQKKDIQLFQKNNVVQWFMQISQKLSQRLVVYLEFVLTINRTFYSNNPIEFVLTKEDQRIKDIFCHLSVGTTPLSATQIFGKSESEAVAIIQLMSQNLISRLISLYQLINQSVVPNAHDSRNYMQAVKLLGFCLEWLRNRKKGEQSSANEIVRKISRNYQILLPIGQACFIKEQLKLIQSYLSIGVQVPNHIKFDIQYHLYQLINHYDKSLDSMEIQNKNEQQGFLAQQAFVLLIISPPASNQHEIHRKLVSIWSKQRNQSYFFNQSRVILELASLYPEEMAKLKILSQYQASSALRPAQQRYKNGERSAESMKWIWALHIATSLVSNSDSVLVVDEVSNFVSKNKLQLYKTLEGNQKRITRAYTQELEATLNLFSILLCNGLWITRNNQILQEVTYIMSHNLIKYFVGIAQRKIVPVAESSNQKVLNEAKFSTLYQDTEMLQELQPDHMQNIFELQIKIKTLYCLRFYFIAMQIAFFKSHYIQKYFTDYVFGSNRYISSFWDSFGKDLIVLFNYTLSRTEQWLSIKRVKKLIQMMNNCYNAPSTFIQNAFLTSIIELPQNDSEVFSDLYLLCFLVTKLAVTHFIRMRTYTNKYNNLLTAHNEKFGKRIKQHIIQVGELSKRLPPSSQALVSYQSFRKQAQVIDIRTPSK